MVLLDVLPEFSVANVTRDEIYGIRPREFPNEKVKKYWLTSWFKLYSSLFEEIRKERKGQGVFNCDQNTNVQDIVEKIIIYLEVEKN